MQTILKKEILTMKKIFIVMLALLLSIAFTTAALAASTIGDRTGLTMTSTSFGGGTYIPSSKVTVNVTTDVNGLSYCASSQHSGASTNQTAGRQFATKSISPQILFAPSETTPGPIPCATELLEGTPTNGTWQ